MNSNTLKHLQYFVGKVCSVVTTSRTGESRDPLVVRVGEVTADGVWGTHVYNNMASFFPMQHVTAVHEEPDPDSPEYAPLVSEHEGRKTPETSLPVLDKKPAPTAEEALATGDTTFVDIASLERLAEQTKRSFDAYNQSMIRKR